MIWLLNDFDLLSVLLHAAALSLEALLIGGVLFLLLVAAPEVASGSAIAVCRRGAQWAAGGLIAVELAAMGVQTTLLVVNAQMSVVHALTAGPLVAEAGAALCALLLLFLLRGTRLRRVATVSAAAGLLAATMMLSHAASRLEHRTLLMGLTAAHHLGTAAWVGAMPFLLLALKQTSDPEVAQRLVGRYSAMAIVAVSLLVGAGAAMAWFYIDSLPALYGTAYGVMVLVKVYLAALMLGLGAANWYMQRQVQRAPAPLLARLRRFAEAEIGLGFTAILAAASLTSQPPAKDLVMDRLSSHEIESRMRWEPPLLKSPPLKSLVPPTPIEEAVHRSQYVSSVNPSDANDRAWSEYNHHWAGVVVLIAGAFALLSRWERLRWARFWPVSFAGLAIFILLRADPENWPLGPRPFWASFYAPDVLQHRVYALLILLFAAFECAVQAGWVRVPAARLAFPTMCAVGAALLLTHNHALGNIKEELLAEMSHSSLALFGATAGWARWLELRLPGQARGRRLAGYVWPVALMLVGVVLLDYRES